MSSQDRRGFVYALQVPMTRREWAVERLMLRIAGSQAAQQKLEAALREATAKVQGASEQAQSSWSLWTDPVSRQRALEHLVRLREHQVGLQGRVDTVRGQIRQLEVLLARAQVKLSVLEQHRSGQEAEFAQAQQRGAERAADDQWITLSHWRKAAGREGAR